jgi:hypothetical protein
MINTRHRQGMLKEGVAVWTHVPGTPFTLPGSPTIKERLPGMTEWADRDMIQRVAKKLKSGGDVEDVAGEEAQEGQGKALGIGAAAGSVGGGLLGRLLGGKKVFEPFKDIGRKGLSGRTLSALSKIPTAAKILPLVGAGAGGYLAHQKWQKGADKREQQALDVSKGLLAERVLQQSAINQAINSSQQGAPNQQQQQVSTPGYRPLLTGVPLVSASAPTPYVMASGNIGI